MFKNASKQDSIRWKRRGCSIMLSLIRDSIENHSYNLTKNSRAELTLERQSCPSLSLPRNPLSFMTLSFQCPPPNAQTFVLRGRHRKLKRAAQVLQSVRNKFCRYGPLAGLCPHSLLIIRPCLSAHDSHPHLGQPAVQSRSGVDL